GDACADALGVFFVRFSAGGEHDDGARVGIEQDGQALGDDFGNSGDAGDERDAHAAGEDGGVGFEAAGLGDDAGDFVVSEADEFGGHYGSGDDDAAGEVFILAVLVEALDEASADVEDVGDFV